LVRPAAVIDQYERAFTSEIKTEIDRLGQQKEELDRQLEVERLAQIERENLAYEQSLINLEFESEEPSIDFSDEPTPDQSRSPNLRADKSPDHRGR
jgi:hypothetical protein